MADGIRIMQEDAKEEQDKAIAYETEWLENIRSHLVANRNNGCPSQGLADIFKKDIERTEQRIDSLRKNDPYKGVFYEDTESDMVLAVYVTCKYSIVFPGKNNTCQERTETFILSPDGETVLGREKKGMKK